MNYITYKDFYISWLKSLFKGGFENMTSLKVINLS